MTLCKSPKLGEFSICHRSEVAKLEIMNKFRKSTHTLLRQIRTTLITQVFRKTNELNPLGGRLARGRLFMENFALNIFNAKKNIS